MSEVKVQWHSGFVAAMNLELSANRNNLIYEKEYNLNTKPLEIDLLVIKKDKDVEIENEIGKIFRGSNILEYKSPTDHLNIDTFYKVGAYASLYKAYGDTVNERKAEDITVSIVRDRRPKSLFRYFAEHGIRVENPYCGIYYVLDEVLFPTQIIVAKELRESNHIWLKSLSDQLKKEELRRLLEQVEGLTQKLEKELADSVLEVSIRANLEIVDELKGDENVCQALLEIMEPEINKIAAEAARKAAEEARRKAVEETRREMQEQAERKARRVALEAVKKMIGSGKFTVEEIMEYVPGISVEEVRAIERGLMNA